MRSRYRCRSRHGGIRRNKLNMYIRPYLFPECCGVQDVWFFFALALFRVRCRLCSGYSYGCGYGRVRLVFGVWGVRGGLRGWYRCHWIRGGLGWIDAEGSGGERLAKFWSGFGFKADLG